MTPMRFDDRRDAGRRLGERLRRHAGRPDVVVLGLTRGGVPVAAEVARALGAPLDVLVVRKLGVPSQPELAMGAIASGGVRVVNEEVVRLAGITPDVIERAAEIEGRELARRERLYRGGRPALDVKGRTVIVVDDGLATGSTMLAAVKAIRQLQPSRVIVAVPVGAPESCQRLADSADELVCIEMPVPFSAVGLWYDDFSQTSDEEVRALLDAAGQPAGPPHGIRA